VCGSCFSFYFLPVLGLWSGCKEHPRSAPAIFLLLISVVRQQEWHLIWLCGSVQPPSVSLGFPDAVCAASALFWIRKLIYFLKQIGSP
jgi:hypothetical protein